jgi:hypothetical protein
MSLSPTTFGPTKPFGLNIFGVRLYFNESHLPARASQNKTEESPDMDMDAFLASELDTFIAVMLAWGDNTTEKVKKIYKEIQKGNAAGKWKPVRQLVESRLEEQQRHQ